VTTTRSRRTTSRAVRLGVIGAASLLLLTGCAGAHPGVAAQVGDESITLSKVDALAASYCTAIKPQLGASAQAPAAISFTSLRAGVLQQLIAREIADRVGADYGVSAGVAYSRAVQSAKTAATAIPAKVRDDYIEVQTAGDYISDVVTQAAQKDLVAAGNAKPTQEQISARASELFTQYTTSADIEIDPRFGIGSDLLAKDGNVSFAVSDTAKAGVKAADDDTTYAQALPASQRCGK
jgi:hypothetical protein